MSVSISHLESYPPWPATFTTSETAKMDLATIEFSQGEASQKLASPRVPPALIPVNAIHTHRNLKYHTRLLLCRTLFVEPTHHRIRNCIINLKVHLFLLTTDVLVTTAH